MWLINKTIWFNNIPCTYHRIIDIKGNSNEEPVEYDWENRIDYVWQTMIEVWHYIDRATRDARKYDFVVKRPFTMPWFDKTWAQAYEYLQTLPEFEGATSDE